MRGIIWTMKELAEVLRKRQLNKFDVNIGVSGKRGNGKSTFINKLLNHYKDEGFNQRKQQVYDRDELIQLLGNQMFGFAWDDEAINSGYKRDFQSTGQKELIKIVTSYRDNYNMYISALPFFYSLDKDLRELIFLHVHIIERGVAVLFMPLPGRIHGSDPWDSKTNMKIEEKENNRIAKNPELQFRYDKFTTFVGYLYFNDLTEKQQALYKKIKQEKRENRFKLNQEVKLKDMPLKDRLFNLLKEQKLTLEGIRVACLLEGEKYTSMLRALGEKLKDEGSTKTLTQVMEEYLDKDKIASKKQLLDLMF